MENAMFNWPIKMMKKPLTFLSSAHYDCVVANPANEDLPFAEPIRSQLLGSHVVWVELTSNYQISSNLQMLGLDVTVSRYSWKRMWESILPSYESSFSLSLFSSKIVTLKSKAATDLTVGCYRQYLPSGVWGIGKLVIITQHLHLQ